MGVGRTGVPTPWRGSVPTPLVESLASRCRTFLSFSGRRLPHQVAAAHRTAAAVRRTPGAMMRSVPVPSHPPPSPLWLDRRMPGHIRVPTAANSGVRKKPQKSKTTTSSTPRWSSRRNSTESTRTVARALFASDPLESTTWTFVSDPSPWSIKGEEGARLEEKCRQFPHLRSL